MVEIAVWDKESVGKYETFHDKSGYKNNRNIAQSYQQYYLVAGILCVGILK